VRIEWAFDLSERSNVIAEWSGRPIQKAWAEIRVAREIWEG
jgi:hypothetical protein